MVSSKVRESDAGSFVVSVNSTSVGEVVSATKTPCKAAVEETSTNEFPTMSRMASTAKTKKVLDVMVTIPVFCLIWFNSEVGIVTVTIGPSAEMATQLMENEMEIEPKVALELVL